MNETSPLLNSQTIIALVVMGIFAGTVAAVFMLGDATSKAQTVGGVLAIAGAAANYFFASSAGSQKKDETITRLSVKPATPETPQ